MGVSILREVEAEELGRHAGGAGDPNIRKDVSRPVLVAPAQNGGEHTDFSLDKADIFNIGSAVSAGRGAYLVRKPDHAAGHEIAGTRQVLTQGCTFGGEVDGIGCGVGN